MHPEPVTDETLWLYLDGELEPDGVAQLEARLPSDPETAARLESFRRFNGAVETLQISLSVLVTFVVGEGKH